MRAVEAHLLDIIQQLAAMHQPITPTEAIELAISLVRGTVTEQEMKNWKQITNPIPDHDNHDKIVDCTTVGLKWWKNFYNRKCNVIKKNGSTI